MPSLLALAVLTWNNHIPKGSETSRKRTTRVTPLFIKMSALHCFCLSNESTWLLLILTGIFCLCNRMIFAVVGLPMACVSLNKPLRLSAPSRSSCFSWTLQGLGFSIWAKVGMCNPVGLSIKYLVLFFSFSLTGAMLPTYWKHSNHANPCLPVTACSCKMSLSWKFYTQGLKLSSWCQILLNFTSMKAKSTPMPNAEHAGSVSYSPKSMILFQKNLNPVSPEAQHPLLEVKSRTVHSFNPATEHFWHLLPGAKLVAHYNLISFSAQVAGNSHIYVLSPLGWGEPLLQQCNVDQTLNKGHKGYSWKLD